MTPIVLLVGLYHEPVPARAHELTACLARNLHNPQLSKICVFAEDAEAPVRKRPLLQHPKITVIDHGQRVRYSDLFHWANRNLPGKISVIANADIYFDDTLRLLTGMDLRDKLLCLSRWDVHADGTAHLFEYAYSQDAWIFQAPLRPVRCDFHLGTPGCDNRLAWEAQAAGLRVENPSRSIRAYHLHGSGLRREQAPLTGPLLAVPLSALDEERS